MPTASRPSRLNPTQLNNLVLSYMIGTLTEEKGYTIQDEIDKDNKLVPFKKISKNETSIFVFQAVSDAKKTRQNLAYINEVIQQFEKNNPEQKTTLLIPLMQSRLWKQHCVLVEVNIEEGRKKINTYDSQSWWRNLFYPNCLKDLKKQGYQVKYIHHAKQADNYSCVYFVYHYIKEILEKSSGGLKNIFVSLNTLEGQDPIGKSIQDNFKQKYSDVRKIESGESIPWEKDSKASYEAHLGISDATRQSQVDSIYNGEDFVEISSLSKLTKLKKNTKAPFFQSSSNVLEENERTAQNLIYSR
ncbi:hypothetical protein [Rickettsiella endosymbiont of Litargus connexus]|jgi:hypothetical protein|uniref:hypothetical protein n=1 Tax=Rickettsiella endosymbiont of Litargus connexus TaxID=3066237 RepID=UPI00376EA87D|nr:hypothetical protein [Gammaproteobacteria bacterium]